jgi:hypothetical protein
MSYAILCADHLIEFEKPKHQFLSTWLFGWPEYFFNYYSELLTIYGDWFRKGFGNPDEVRKNHYL